MRSPLLKSALAMAASAAYIVYRSRKSEEEHPPTGQFVEVDGIRLHYTERGSGRPLVLLHGNSTMALDFELSGLVDMAAERYRVIVFDRPGYGYSERPRDRIWGAFEQARLFQQAFRAIGVERPLVLGHSWGAMVAVALALDYPKAMSGLVLASGYYYPTVRPEIPLAAPPAIPVIGDVMRYTVSPLMFRALWPAMLKRMFAPAEVTDSFKSFPVWMAVRPPQLEASSAEAALVIPDAMKLSKRYAELKLPTVIITGRDDQLVHMDAHSARLHVDVPTADFRVLDGLGHMIHHLNPGAVLDAIDSLADKVDASSSTAATSPIVGDAPDIGQQG